jgi:hypothetical protein
MLAWGFYGFGLTCRSLIHSLELVFVYSVRQGSDLTLFFSYGYPIFQLVLFLIISFCSQVDNFYHK